MDQDRSRRQGLLRQFDVRRRLPAATNLPRPETAVEDQLWNELLVLPQSSDPLHWLTAERSAEVAQIAVYDSLANLQRYVEGARRASVYGWTGIGPRWLVELVSQPQSMAAFVPPVSTGGPRSLPTPDALRRLLATLRIAMKDGMAEDRQTIENAEPWLRLLTDVLALAEGTDPFQWVQRERGDLASEIVLRRILASTQPIRSLEVGPPIQALRLRHVFRPADRIRVVVTEVLVGAGAMRITMRVRMDSRGLRRYPNHITLDWNGFETVTDDQGNSYLMQHLERGESQGILWWSCHTLQQVFYPAPVPDVRELTFSAGAASVTTRHFRLPTSNDERLAAVGGVSQIGREVEWVVRVPAG